jgi:hypothetical protein
MFSSISSATLAPRAFPGRKSSATSRRAVAHLIKAAQPLRLENMFIAAKI